MSVKANRRTAKNLYTKAVGNADQLVSATIFWLTLGHTGRSPRAERDPRAILRIVIVQHVASPRPHDARPRTDWPIFPFWTSNGRRAAATAPDYGGG